MGKWAIFCHILPGDRRCAGEGPTIIGNQQRERETGRVTGRKEKDKYGTEKYGNNTADRHGARARERLS